MTRPHVRTCFRVLTDPTAFVNGSDGAFVVARSNAPFIFFDEGRSVTFEVDRTLAYVLGTKPIVTRRVFSPSSWFDVLPFHEYVQLGHFFVPLFLVSESSPSCPF